MASLLFKKSLADAWQMANQSKTTIWGGIGLIVVFAMLFMMPEVLYQFYIITPHIPFNPNNSIPDPAVVMSTVTADEAHRLAVVHQIFSFVVNFALLVLFASFTQIGIFLGSGLPAELSNIFKKIPSFVFLKVFIIYFLECIVALITILFVALTITQFEIVSVCIGFVITFSLLYLSARGYLIIPILYTKKEGLWSAIKHSFRLTKGNGLKIIFIKILAAFLFILGALPLLIGLIWTVPLINLLRGSVYKQLENE